MSASTQRQSLEIDIPFTSNMAIDFFNLAEEKYGFAVVHPEARTAADFIEADGAEGADKGEGDADDDDDDEDNNEDDDGVNQNDKEEETENNDGKERKRKRGEGRYDLNDPFIDDSEMAWEEQAAATKDGFFVFAGQLVDKNAPQEIEKEDKKKVTKRKIKVDDAKPTKKKRLVNIAPADGKDASALSISSAPGETPAAVPPSAPNVSAETEKPKVKRPRKPKDPNAPPKPRKPRVKKEKDLATESPVAIAPAPAASAAPAGETGTHTSATNSAPLDETPIKPKPKRVTKPRVKKVPETTKDTTKVTTKDTTKDTPKDTPKDTSIDSSAGTPTEPPKATIKEQELTELSSKASVELNPALVLETTTALQSLAREPEPSQ